MEQVIQKLASLIGLDLVNGIFNVLKVVDIIVFIILAIVIFNFLKKYTKVSKLIIVSTLAVIGLILCYVLDLTILKYAIIIFFCFYLMIFAVLVSHEYKMKNTVSPTERHSEKAKVNLTADEKQQLVDTLVKSVVFLSTRKTGAIITVERANNLGLWIEKGVQLDSEVTFELLTTIFYNGTALHDGAVIIRGNRIACAATFYPSSENADLPKQYGSRHRAALGISEVSDSLTVVVSEETGNISVMIGGTITPGVTQEELSDILNHNIMVK